eukprot:2690077-Pleurochrysis_carterae.AAC.1
MAGAKYGYEQERVIGRLLGNCSTAAEQPSSLAAEYPSVAWQPTALRAAELLLQNGWLAHSIECGSKHGVPLYDLDEALVSPRQ